MALTIWPTANDVAPVAGDGNKYLEQSFAALVVALVGQNFVLSGFVLPATDPDLTISVPLGTAWIDGHTVDLDAATGVALAANQTNHIFLKLVKDGGGNVDNALFEANTTGTAPADSVKIGTAITDGSTVTSTTDARILTSATLHKHLDSQNGGLLGADSVGTTQVKVTAKSFSTGTFNSNSAKTFEFTVTGKRIGDFTLQYSGPFGTPIGESSLSQIQLIDVTTENTRWRLSIVAHSSGAIDQVVTVRWDELAVVT